MSPLHEFSSPRCYRLSTGFLPILLACSALAFSSCALALGPSDGPDDGSPSPTEALGVLRALGVEAVDSPPPAETLSAAGTTELVDPEVWHPLKTPYAVFSPKAEVFQIGIGTPGPYIPDQPLTVWLSAQFEDGEAGYPAAYGEPRDFAWNEDGTDLLPPPDFRLPRAGCAADLDGDGIDEFVVFHIEDGALRASVWYGGLLSDSVPVPGVTLSIGSGGTLFGSGGPHMLPIPMLQIAALDLDGDGQDEIALLEQMTVYFLELAPSSASATVLASRTFAGHVTSLAPGDPDGDGREELGVCVFCVGFSAYRGDFTQLPTAVPVLSFTVQEACFGDFDGDNMDELVLCSAGMSSVAVTLFHCEPGSGAMLAAGTFDHAYVSGTHPYRIMPLSLDADGDGDDELFLNTGVYLDPLDADSDGARGLRAFANGAEEWLKLAVVGDVDGDGAEEVVALHHRIVDETSLAGEVVRSLGYDGTSFTDEHGYSDWQQTLLITDFVTLEEGVHWSSQVDHYSAWYNSVVLAVGNVDRDSARVRYVGHELAFTDPAVVAVLASPPYWSAVAAANPSYHDAYTGWETAFGQVTSQSSAEGVAAGFSLGVTLEFEQELSIFGIKAAQFKASTTFTGSVDWKLSLQRSIEKSVTYRAAGGEDKVLFTSVPMDVYSYEVVESPVSPADVGRTMTIEIPRDYDFYLVTREFYNANNGPAFDIDETIMGHVMGNPDSYPSATEKSALLAEHGGYASGDALPASQASDSSAGLPTSLDILVSSGTETELDLGLEIESQVGGGVAGLSVLFNWGFRVGYSYTTSASAGTAFGGSVGYLPTSFYMNPAYNYSAGLFAYPYFDHRDNRLFWVVTYWVE